MTMEKNNNMELLKEEELDNVAGGFQNESLDDIDSLRRNCGVKLGYNYDSNLIQLSALFSNAGIKFHAHNNHPNEYYDRNTGRELKHEAAIQALREHIGNLY